MNTPRAPSLTLNGKARSLSRLFALGLTFTGCVWLSPSDDAEVVQAGNNGGSGDDAGFFLDSSTGGGSGNSGNDDAGGLSAGTNGGDGDGDSGAGTNTTDAATEGGGSDASTPDNAIRAEGDPCFVTGEGACLGYAQRDRLVCDGSQWVDNGSCSVGDNCDTTPGNDAGSCSPILAECDGEEEGALFCGSGSVRACGPDLVTSTVTQPCDNACLAGSCVDCTPEDKRCADGLLAQTCLDTGAWNAGTPCDAVCQSGDCLVPPSCSGVGSCQGSTHCCMSYPIPAGSFSRNYDGVTTGFEDASHEATLSAFQLDRYEVTVSRFRNFVNAYPGSQPSEGAGQNPNVQGDPGWQAAYTLPATADDLKAQLACTDGTWTDIAQSNEGRPINCVSWFVAYAFCIWDGGRLPTDAEWNYVASGGDEQRVYPWSSPASSSTISAAHAVYGQTSGLPATVGSKSPTGDGTWGHADLAGNVYEWALDWYLADLPSSCDDCAALTPNTDRVLRGGGYRQATDQLYVASTVQAPPDYFDRTTGVRCARNP